MNFIFQFGEFTGDESTFWSDLSIAVIGAFIGTGGAIWLYYTQVKDQNKRQNEEKNQLQIDKLKYLHHLLKLVILGVDKSTDSLNVFYEDIIKSPAHLSSMAIVPIYDFNRIVNVLNQEDHYHSYLSHIKNDKISQIFSSVDFLYGTLIDLEKNYNYTVQHDLERRNNYAKSIKLLIDTIVIKHQLIKVRDGKENNYYKILNRSILNYHEQLDKDPSDLLQMNKSFVFPLLEIIAKIKDSEDIGIITKIASDTHKLMSPILLSNKDFSLQVKTTCDTIAETNSKLKILITDLSSFVENNH